MRARRATLVRGMSTNAMVGVILGVVLLGLAGVVLSGALDGGNVAEKDADETPRVTVDTTDVTPDDPAEEARRTEALPQAASSDSAAGAAPITFDPPEFDFGIIKPSHTARGVINIRNDGAEPLRIIQSKSSCTCTSVDLANTVIEPGDSVEMELIYKGKMSIGPATAKVRVIFDGYDAPSEAVVRGEVALAVRAIPGWLSGLDAQSGVFDVTSVDGRPFSVLAVDGQEPPFVGFDPSTDAPRDRYTLAWDITEYDGNTCMDAMGNRMPSWLAIETDHPEAPIFDVYLRHFCTRATRPNTGQNWIMAERRYLVGLVEPGESAEFAVDMKWLGNATPDDIARAVTTDSDRFDVELVSATEKALVVECLIRLTPKPDLEGLFKGDIYIHGQRGVAPLRVIGTVRPDELLSAN